MGYSLVTGGMGLVFSCDVWTSTTVGSLVAEPRASGVQASAVAAHGLGRCGSRVLEHGLNSCGARAY